MTGCSGKYDCIAACPNLSCIDACDTNTTAAGKMLYTALDDCLFMTACPNTNGGVCDVGAANFSTCQCNACTDAALAQGGACFAQLQACRADKP
jgi:hypothetical protein